MSHATVRAALSGGRVQPAGEDLPDGLQRGAARERPVELLDPYDWYLAGFRSAYLGHPPAISAPPTPRQRAAFELGVDDGRARCVAPRSRWELDAAVGRLR